MVAAKSSRTPIHGPLAVSEIQVTRAMTAPVRLVQETEDAPIAPPNDIERRSGEERRRSPFRAIWFGHQSGRRRNPRRDREQHPVAVDWHRSHLLGVVILILLLSMTDALFTLTLLGQGANEANPLMEPLVTGSGRWFAFWKVGLTTAGVVMLVLLSRYRLFGWVRVGALLYVVLALYVTLVAYEWSLLHRIGA
jgi:Domain of unknown function (DUF5658)